jgi:hypothetical protein
MFYSMYEFRWDGVSGKEKSDVGGCERGWLFKSWILVTVSKRGWEPV